MIAWPAGRDTVDGGGGDTMRVRNGPRRRPQHEQDTVFADREDVVRHCERVRRS